MHSVQQLPVWLLIGVYTLAGARMTGLIVTDSITEPVRDWIIERLDPRPRTAGALLAELIGCPWCAGMWVAIVEVPLIWWWGTSPVMLIPALVLAFSQITGMIAGVGRG